MKDEIKTMLTSHMKEFGLNMIGKGLVNSTFNEMHSPYNHAMSIVHIAHGTELIIKSKIAEEHPLLIFSKIPKSTNSNETKLGVLDLLDKGQTIMYSELPKRLWATTGYKIENIDLYNEFGKIRNQIVHLGVPELELSDLALNFGFGVIENLVNEWWDETLLNYALNYDDAYLEYIFEQLNRLSIPTKFGIDKDYKLKKKTI